MTASFSGYSILSEHGVALRDGFRQVISLIVLASVPVALGIAVVAEPLRRIRRETAALFQKLPTTLGTSPNPGPKR